MRPAQCRECSEQEEESRRREECKVGRLTLQCLPEDAAETELLEPQKIDPIRERKPTNQEHYDCQSDERE